MLIKLLPSKHIHKSSDLREWEMTNYYLLTCQRRRVFEWYLRHISIAITLNNNNCLLNIILFYNKICDTKAQMQNFV